MNGALCFVLMPFGQKPSDGGTVIDFDAVYRQILQPAITAAGLQPLRADEEMSGGIIHTPMFERLLLCEYAVADLTTANANVFYELGIRHAARPRSTVLLFATGGRLPFDVAPLRALPYHLTPAGVPLDPDAAQRMLTERLVAARRETQGQPAVDSPIHQLVPDYPNIDAGKAASFQRHVQEAAQRKEQIAAVRRQVEQQFRGLGQQPAEVKQQARTAVQKQGVRSLQTLEDQWGSVAELEPGVVIALFLAYRFLEAWQEMIALVGKMSHGLRETVMVQEQLALALNRDGKGEQAEQVLKGLVERRGPSSETCGILGRVYKDRWKAALSQNRPGYELEALLEDALEAYLRGFETDWRDYYPGVNALTLMEFKETPDPRRDQILPVVQYAVDRRIAVGEPNYWDFAARLELAVLAGDQATAQKTLGLALRCKPEPWQKKTTADNFRLIRNVHVQRNLDAAWLEAIIKALDEV